MGSACWWVVGASSCLAILAGYFAVDCALLVWLVWAFRVVFGWLRMLVVIVCWFDGWVFAVAEFVVVVVCGLFLTCLCFTVNVRYV